MAHSVEIVDHTQKTAIRPRNTLVPRRSGSDTGGGRRMRKKYTMNAAAKSERKMYRSVKVGSMATNDSSSGVTHVRTMSQPIIRLWGANGAATAAGASFAAERRDLSLRRF